MCDLEEVLKKIIDIDERAKKIRKETETLARTQEEELEKEMKKIERDLLSRAEKEGKAAYDAFINEGESKVGKIITEGEKCIRQLESYFNTHEKALQQTGFRMIFKQYE